MSAVLDCAKVSDVMIIAWPPLETISEEQILIITALMAQGLPTTLHVVCGMPVNGKIRDQMRKTLAKSMERWYSFVLLIFYQLYFRGMSDEKLLSLDNSGDALQILR